MEFREVWRSNVQGVPKISLKMLNMCLDGGVAYFDELQVFFFCETYVEGLKPFKVLFILESYRYEF